VIDTGDEVWLAEKLCHWRKVLRLQDWEIRARYVHQWELDDPSTRADCYYGKTERRAVIRMLKPEEFPDDPTWEKDPETSLVHELLHVVMSEFCRPEEGSRDEELFEKAINSLALALVGLERERGDR
jgi:hypothetical protein